MFFCRPLFCCHVIKSLCVSTGLLDQGVEFMKSMQWVWSVKSAQNEFVSLSHSCSFKELGYISCFTFTALLFLHFFIKVGKVDESWCKWQVCNIQKQNLQSVLWSRKLLLLDWCSLLKSQQARTGAVVAWDSLPSSGWPLTLQQRRRKRSKYKLSPGNIIENHKFESCWRVVTKVSDSLYSPSL